MYPGSLKYRLGCGLCNPRAVSLRAFSERYNISEAHSNTWQYLALDPGMHNALLRALGKGYKDIYLAQKHRPKEMGYFDFVMSEVHAPRVKELLDEKAA